MDTKRDIQAQQLQQQFDQILKDLNSDLTSQELDTLNKKNYDQFGAILLPQNQIPPRDNQTTEFLSNALNHKYNHFVKLILKFETFFSSKIEEQQ